MGGLATLLEEKRQESWQKGRQEGRQEGQQEGRQEGEAALLLRLLERRFGPLPPAMRQRITAANDETLLLYGERLLDAKSLDEIFAA